MGCDCELQPARFGTCQRGRNTLYDVFWAFLAVVLLQDLVFCVFSAVLVVPFCSSKLTIESSTSIVYV